MTEDPSAPPPPPPPDVAALARRTLDLWERQIAAVAQDPRLAEATARSLSFMAEMAHLGGWSAPQTPETAPGTPHAPSAAPPGPAPDGPAFGAANPHAGSLDGSELVQRVAALERRVALLETALGGLLAKLQG
ncbi:hypothetical protein [Pararhodospirillum photometricum]|uniref:hypothetical protein n=1 Tax=Pararhodospirillum photometricum TaxID=1084 RepID=UPI0002E98F9C|nr:hypothetical protein [Pararhodospirillum photometricum]